jgi:hypothetical protein
VGGTAVLVAGINGLFFRRLLGQDRAERTLPPVSRIARFSVGHTAVALTVWVPDFLVPLLVLRLPGRPQRRVQCRLTTLRRSGS